MGQYDLPYTGPQVEALLAKISELESEMPSKTSDLTNDSGFITSEDVPTKTSDLNNDSGFITNAPVAAEAARAQAAEALLATISSLQAEITRATGVEGTLQDLIDGIAAKIPSAATAQNQLADKDFVNSSIATATATFRGTYNSLAELQAVSADENDYGYVRATDAAGNTIFKRYKYASGSWVFEYDLNNSSFTASQWAAINSAITAELVEKLRNLPTNAALTELLNGKQGVIPDLDTIRSNATAGGTAYQKPAGGIPKSDMSADVQTSLGKADSAVQESAIADNLTTDDAKKVLSAKQGVVLAGQISQLGQKLEHVEVVDDSSSDEGIEFQEDDGTFIASVSAKDGVKSKGFVIKDENGENPINLYTEEKDDDRLAFGDENGNDIVLFFNGGILTKNFDSRVIAPALMDIAQLKRQNGGDSASERKNEFLPDFYSYKKGKSGGWFDRLRLMHFSDTHNNSTNLAEALSLSRGLVDAVIDTGDNANGIASTVASSTIAELQNYVNVGRNNNPTPTPLLICNGNHDVPNLTKKQYYDIMCDYMSETATGFVFGDSEGYRSYGYYDITPNSTIGTVRIITLDPFDYADGQFMNPYGTTGVGGWMNCVFSQKQINWLIAILRSAVASGYKVITAMHYSWGDNTVFTESGSANPDANYHQDPFMIPDIIDAMQNKTTLSKSYPDDENINNITINEDFSGINDFHYICHLFGHIHSENEYQCQKTDGSKFYNILMVGAPNMGSEGLAINKVPLQPGTTNSIKLTVLEIDTVEKAIYRVNYGAYKAFDMSITERTKKIPYTFNK